MAAFGTIVWYSAQAGTSWHFAHVVATFFMLLAIRACQVDARAALIGLLFGAANLYFLLQITGRDLSGMYLPYRFPFSLALMLLPTILAAAFFSALWPAESAVRTSLVEALEYE